MQVTSYRVAICKNEPDSGSFASEYPICLKCLPRGKLLRGNSSVFRLITKFETRRNTQIQKINFNPPFATVCLFEDGRDSKASNRLINDAALKSQTTSSQISYSSSSSASGFRTCLFLSRTAGLVMGLSPGRSSPSKIPQCRNSVV